MEYKLLIILKNGKEIITKFVVNSKDSSLESLFSSLYGDGDTDNQFSGIGEWIIRLDDISAIQVISKLPKQS